MARQHFMVSFDVPDDDEDVLGSVESALSKLAGVENLRVKEGFPRVLVVIPNDNDEDAIVATDARIQLSFLDCRQSVGIDLEDVEDRMRRGIEIGSSSTHFETQMVSAIETVKNDIEAEQQEADLQRYSRGL